MLERSGASVHKCNALLALLCVIIAPLWMSCPSARNFVPGSGFNASQGDGGTITINWASPHQAIDGFGAATAGVNPPLSSKLMDLFYTDKGIHLNLIRLEIWSSVADCETAHERGLCVASSNATLSKDDLANAQAAVARGALVWAAQWSPPGSMKPNGVLTGAPFVGNGANFAELARLQTSFVDLLTKTYGIPLYALSPQNEPDYSTTAYASCTWTPQQLHDYIPYLAQALKSAGYGSVKLMIAEEGIWGNSYNAIAMNDPAVASQISILAAHEYKNVLATPLSWNNLTTQHIWETEVGDFDAYDGSMRSGLAYAKMIHGALTAANVNAWHYWSLSGILFHDNEGLTDDFGHPAKRAYTLGNYSKFVLPGWTRVDVANNTGLLVSAFKGPDTGAAIVVVNSGPVASQEFAVGNSMGTSVVPWITSQKLNLQAQPPIPVSFSGSFTTTIPANSVVTFNSKR